MPRQNLPLPRQNLPLLPHLSRLKLLQHLKFLKLAVSLWNSRQKCAAGVEGDIVRLTLEVDDLGNITPTAQIEGNVVVGETIEIPDLYETHNVTAEAQLDLAGMDGPTCRCDL